MQIYTVLILLLSFTYTPLSFGQSSIRPLENILGENLTTELFNCFEEAYYDKEVYVPFFCNRNTSKLYGKCFHPRKVEGHVIYLLSVSKAEDIERDRPTRRIFPSQSRGEVNEWSFHTFLEVEGHIFDLDYTKVPQAVDIFTYFEKMFKVSSSKVQYVVRIIPASDYYLKYDDNSFNWNYYIENKDGFYPLQDVLAYLKNFDEDDVERAMEHLALSL